jgi:hypothetical protein
MKNQPIEATPEQTLIAVILTIVILGAAVLALRWGRKHL